MIAETERLILRKFTQDDAVFILELLNTPGWIKYIGDRNITSIEKASTYITERFLPHYQTMGFSFYLVALRDTQTPIGMCGLVKRDWLDDVDIGFALVPAYEGKGYAYEASVATLDHAKELGLKRITAITVKHNSRSIALLNKIGLHYEKMIVVPGENEELLLLSVDF